MFIKTRAIPKMKHLKMDLSEQDKTEKTISENTYLKTGNSENDKNEKDNSAK